MQQLRLTVRAWKKYGYESQLKILQKYDVILIDHHTRKQKILKIFKKFSARNLDRGVAKFNLAIDAWDDVMDDFSKSINKAYGRSERPISEQFWGANDNNHADVKKMFWGEGGKSF